MMMMVIVMVVIMLIKILTILQYNTNTTTTTTKTTTLIGNEFDGVIEVLLSACYECMCRLPLELDLITTAADTIIAISRLKLRIDRIITMKSTQNIFVLLSQASSVNAPTPPPPGKFCSCYIYNDNNNNDNNNNNNRNTHSKKN